MTEEETYGTVILTALGCILIGYTLGRQTMKRDLLAGLDCALRIFQERKE